MDRTFIRVHRSSIININYLKEIGRHFNGGHGGQDAKWEEFPGKQNVCTADPQKVV